MIFNVILSKHVHINGQKHSGALEQFLSLYGFWVQKIVTEHFEDNKGFCACFMN